MTGEDSKILEQVEKTRHRIQKLEMEIEFERKHLHRLELMLEDSENPRKSSPDSRESGARKGTLEHRMFNLLKRKGELSVTEIVELLEMEGVTSNSENGIKPSVQSTLSRKSDVFEIVRRGVYKLK